MRQSQAAITLLRDIPMTMQRWPLGLLSLGVAYWLLCEVAVLPLPLNAQEQETPAGINFGTPPAAKAAGYADSWAVIVGINYDNSTAGRSVDVRRQIYGRDRASETTAFQRSER